jgi:hypothetical protein
LVQGFGREAGNHARDRRLPGTPLEMFGHGPAIIRLSPANKQS